MAKQRSVAGTKNDPTLQFANLVVDGVTYKCVFSFNAIALAEAEAGCNLLRGLQSLSDLTALQLRGLLYAAMIVAQPETTIADAGSLIRLDTIGPITEALAEAYMLSLPEKKSEKAKASDETN